MDADEFQMALSYAALADSIAFRDFIAFQRAECERLELAALAVPGHEVDAARAAMIAWQQRRLVVRTLEETVRDSAAVVKKENEDGRPEPPADRSGW